ncbi:MAG: hypothetical protein ACRDGA_10515 [Bacteroidota bacterium]
MNRIILSLSLLILLSACSSSNPEKKTGLIRNLITEEEIVNASATNAYELVKQRRPEYLMPKAPKTFYRGPRSTILPVAYLNGAFLGEPSELLKISIETVKEVRYLEPTDATMRYGTGHVAGIIMVITRN